MVKITKIYTRTGDDGTTGLVSGTRVAKTDPRVVAYGTVDEANAAIGLAIAHLLAKSTPESLTKQARTDADRLVSQLTALQHDLFDLGADLATPGHVEGALRLLPAQVDQLEAAIDQWNETLSALTSFVLPGGSLASSCLHLARTITRRAERKVVEVFEHEGTLHQDQPTLRYLNRLSDLLFVVARIANDRGQADVLWEPGKTRPSMTPTPPTQAGGEPG